MTKSESITNNEARSIAVGHSSFAAYKRRKSQAARRYLRGFVIPSSLVIRASAFVALCLSILPAAVGAAENLGILGTHPRWKVLEKYQQTITHDEFAQLIQNVYCTHGIAPDLITIDDNSARILTNREAQSFVTLRFAKDDVLSEPVRHF